MAPSRKPGAGEVLIKVAAAGLNHADLAQAKGRYPPPPGASDILGMEVSGNIAELGSDITGWNEGDQVCALLAGGGYAEFCGGVQGMPAARAQRRFTARCGGAAGSAFHRLDQPDGRRAAQTRRARADPWRLQRHRHGRDPALRRARPRGVLDRRRARKNARRAKASARTRDQLPRRRISSRW